MFDLRGLTPFIILCCILSFGIGVLVTKYIIPHFGFTVKIERVK